MAFLQEAVLLILACSVLQSDTEACLQEDFDDQVERLIQNVSASAVQLSLPGLLQAVEGTLNSVWPGSKVKLFGSLATGLGSASSDADISVELPEGAHSVGNVLHSARAAFESSPQIYHKINTRRRLPSVTMYFAPAKIFCDINFIPQATTFESDLLRFLLNSDERILKLAIIIKYWAKLHKVTGKKYLTSYGMMMLVIFFLQQRSILPPVVELQNKVKGHILKEQYNVAFERKMMITKNNESLYQILGKFFEYYEDFDFDKFIVSPFTGHPIQKSAFKDLVSVPDDFHLYKRNVAKNMTQPFNITAVCVQSLLVHSDNCAWRVDSSNKFRKSFKRAAKSFRDNDMDSFLSVLLGRKI